MPGYLPGYDHQNYEEIRREQKVWIIIPDQQGIPQAWLVPRGYAEDQGFKYFEGGKEAALIGEPGRPVSGRDAPIPSEVRTEVERQRTNKQMVHGRTSGGHDFPLPLEDAISFQEGGNPEFEYSARPRPLPGPGKPAPNKSAPAGGEQQGGKGGSDQKPDQRALAGYLNGNPLYYPPGYQGRQPGKSAAAKPGDSPEKTAMKEAIDYETAQKQEPGVVLAQIIDLVSKMPRGWSNEHGDRYYGTGPESIFNLQARMGHPGMSAAEFSSYLPGSGSSAWQAQVASKKIMDELEMVKRWKDKYGEGPYNPDIRDEQGELLNNWTGREADENRARNDRIRNPFNRVDLTRKAGDSLFYENN